MGISPRRERNSRGRVWQRPNPPDGGNYPLTVGNYEPKVGAFVTRCGPDGVPYRIWEALVPRIPAHFLDCSFYVYQSTEEAQKGVKYGGTGFFVHVRLKHEPWVQIYAVTNKHVIDGGFGVLRVNTRDDKFTTIASVYDSWFQHPDGDDIAVLPLDLAQQHKRNSISMASFVTEKMAYENTIGVGDEVFLIGRLVTREGTVQNKPVARFGHLSMMRDAIMRDDGQRQESFLIECRSVSGFSGSPVFVSSKRLDYVALNPGGDLRIVGAEHVEGLSEGLWLLGVDWSHVPLMKPTYTKDTPRSSPVPNVYADMNTGIAGVVPAWRLRQLLERSDLVAQRAAADEELEKQAEERAEVVLDTEQPPPFTKDDFEDALKRASRKLSDEEKS